MSWSTGRCPATATTAGPARNPARSPPLARCHWAVADADDDTVLGRVSLQSVIMAGGQAEISYWTPPKARGKGVCSRAVSRVSTWALDEVGRRLVGSLTPGRDQVLIFLLAEHNHRPTLDYHGPRPPFYGHGFPVLLAEGSCDSAQRRRSGPAAGSPPQVASRVRGGGDRATGPHPRGSGPPAQRDGVADVDRLLTESARER
ncbi:GNAT family N-acetyltransferase [Streptomyces anulatus]|uniref:GNAT family N-acetyltransferase n=1 Tax=Streptomyces anulatus TaxID=1892 RepID=UPI00386B87E6